MVFSGLSTFAENDILFCADEALNWPAASNFVVDPAWLRIGLRREAAELPRLLFEEDRAPIAEIFDEYLFCPIWSTADILGLKVEDVLWAGGGFKAVVLEAPPAKLVEPEYNPLVAEDCFSLSCLLSHWII